MAITKTIDVGLGFMNVSKCAQDIWTTAKNKEMAKKEKALRIFGDALKITTQTASVVGATPKMRLSLNGITAATEFTQKVVLLSGKEGSIGWGDYLDIGAGTLLMVSDVVNDAIVFKPQFFGSKRDSLRNIAKFGNKVGLAVENRERLQEGFWCFVKRLGQTIDVVVPNRGTGKPFIDLPPEHAESLYRMKRMQSIDQIEEIPSFFENDNVFRQFRCALSGKLIRHLRIVAGTQEWPKPIWFEDRAILQKIQEDQMPAQWPQGTVFAIENLQEFPTRQTQIDERLNYYLDYLHTADLRFIPIEKGVQKYSQMAAILKNLGLERMDLMEDEKIRQAILERVNPDTIANVSVATQERHQFQEGGPPKLIKVIHLIPKVSTWLSAHPLSEDELFEATVLHLQDPTDRSSLLFNQIPFDIHVSTDLQDFAISRVAQKKKKSRGGCCCTIL